MIFAVFKARFKNAGKLKGDTDRPKKVKSNTEMLKIDVGNAARIKGS
ncbi:MAG: hypothetical protein GY866_21060 [Proteobacteria bacterium]|nr:hypothetical protein [Pseudomonadota bacterium]